METAMAHYQTAQLRTERRSYWIDITDRVAAIVRESGIRDGICLVSSPHTTAGISINENADPDVGRDFFWKLNAVFPRNDAYHHTEGNSDSHIKAALVGFSVQVPVHDGSLALGTWQGVYFCEFDGPRSRRFAVTVVGDSA
ncbi:MAG: YjbQ family protein [Chitinivibrionales bacterium]|nr:YjbQ family protein [Chitinivibrionales bacterium]